VNEKSSPIKGWVGTSRITVGAGALNGFACALCIGICNNKTAIIQIAVRYFPPFNNNFGGRENFIIFFHLNEQ
jgi:hypothetical protein